jgi:F0F1-type ATP synthase delta subunit
MRGATFALEAMGSLMHQMERINRETTYMAALELAYRENRKKKQSHAEAKKNAIESAVETTLEATFDFSSYNKPRILNEGVGRLAGQFQSYPWFLSSLLGRKLYTAIFGGKDLEPGERLAAAEVATGTLFNMMLYAGIKGIPLYGLGMGIASMLLWAYSTFADDDEEEGGLSYIDENGELKFTYNVEWWFRNVWLPKFLGPDGTVANLLGLDDDTAATVALAASRGAIPAITDVDVSNSVALEFMFFLPEESRADTLGGKIVEYTFTAFGGAFGNTVMDYAKAAEDLMAGYTNRALERMPRLFGNVAKAYRFAEEGQLNYDRELVGMDKDFWTDDKVILQALSFASTEASQRQEQNYEARTIRKDVEKARVDMLNKFRKVALDTHQYGPTPEVLKERREVMKEVAEFNATYPTHIIGFDTLYETQTNAIEKALKSKASRGVPFDMEKTPYLRGMLRERVEAEER